MTYCIDVIGPRLDFTLQLDAELPKIIEIACLLQQGGANVRVRSETTCTEWSDTPSLAVRKALAHIRETSRNLN